MAKNRINKQITSPQAEYAQKLVNELAKRRIDSLLMYEPLPAQDAFHRSDASERLVRGGNRSGKSTSAFVETARVARNMDPYQKYGDAQKLIYVIGYDQDHIGRVMHRMLLRPGVFEIIRDLLTNEWRAFRPNDASDVARRHECKPAPPLIPQREIKDLVWINKGERVFSVVRLTNGNEIRAFSSKAEPAQGDPVDFVHIDEDLFYDRWVSEMQARLSDRKGKLIWSAFPHSKNDALQEMSERAEQQQQFLRPDVAEFRLTYSGNPFIDADEKRKRLAGWNELERRARDMGEFVTGSVLMYPSYTTEIHGCPREHLREPIDELVEECARYDANNRPYYELPLEWSRYVFIDPGHTVGAALFCCVPPEGDNVLVYDELYLKQCDAQTMAREVARKTSGQLIQAFVIDMHGARLRELGSGESVRDVYRRAFASHGCRSARTGSDFFPGSDDTQAGYAKVRDYLATTETGGARLRFLKDALPNFEWEIRRYKKRIDGDLMRGGETRDEPIKRNDHLMDCLRYLCMFEPKYVRSKIGQVPPSPAVAGFRRFLAAMKKNHDQRSIHLGAGTGR